jgi:hypothetical protein
MHRFRLHPALPLLAPGAPHAQAQLPRPAGNSVLFRIFCGLSFIPAIFVTICVFHADLHSPTGLVVVIKIVPVFSISVRTLLVTIFLFSKAAGIRIAITACLTAAHSPVWSYFAVRATRGIVVVAMHPPVAAHLAIVVP